MIQKRIPLLLLGAVQSVLVQTNTEIHQFDLLISDGNFNMLNGKNIPNNQRYDNQPSFYDDDTLVFSSTKNGQPDIAQYSPLEEKSVWLTNTDMGSEYSPARIPKSNDLSSIRLDDTGLQRLYRYNFKTGKPNVLVKDAKIGYHVWYSAEILVSTVLVDGRMDLMVIDFSDGSNHIHQKNVGRSLLKIPNTDLISFMAKEEEKNEIKSFNPISGTVEPIVAIKDSEDFCWLNDGILTTSIGKRLFKFHPKKDSKWQFVKIFSDNEINSISRIVVNSKNTKLVLVAETSPEHIVQKTGGNLQCRESGGICFVSCPRCPGPGISQGHSPCRHGNLAIPRVSGTVVLNLPNERRPVSIKDHDGA